jgi:hypothetical protein
MRVDGVVREARTGWLGGTIQSVAGRNEGRKEGRSTAMAGALLAGAVSSHAEQGSVVMRMTGFALGLPCSGEEQ